MYFPATCCLAYNGTIIIVEPFCNHYVSDQHKQVKDVDGMYKKFIVIPWSILTEIQPITLVDKVNEPILSEDEMKKTSHE